jgi:hypothetical protein
MSPRWPSPRAFEAHLTASSGDVPPFNERSSTDMRIVRREKYGRDERAVYE